MQDAPGRLILSVPRFSNILGVSICLCRNLTTLEMAQVDAGSCGRRQNRLETLRSPQNPQNQELRSNNSTPCIHENADVSAGPWLRRKVDHSCHIRPHSAGRPRISRSLRVSRAPQFVCHSRHEQHFASTRRLIGFSTYFLVQVAAEEMQHPVFLDLFWNHAACKI